MTDPTVNEADETPDNVPDVPEGHAPTLDHLRTRIDGKTDGQIEQALQQLGPDRVLEYILSTLLAQAFVPAEVSAPAVVQFDLETSAGARSCHVRVADGGYSGHRGAAEAPAATLSLRMPDFLRCITGLGDLAAMEAAGAVRVSGDAAMVASLPRWFGSAA